MEITKEKIIRHGGKRIKKLITLLKPSKKPRSIIYILGYGRSGTSILINLLEHLLYVDAHGEVSEAFMVNYQIDPERFEQTLSKNKFEVVALKPILNSCDANYFLTKNSEARIVWMFRDYRDVTFSALEKFGNRVALELKNYITEDKKEGWIFNQMHPEEKGIIQDQNFASFSDTDWMALVWWFVNHTVWRLELFSSNRFVMIEYNDFVRNPKDYFIFINEFGLLKKNKLYQYIDNTRTGKGKKVDLHPSVRKMCDVLLADLRENKLLLDPKIT